MDVLAGVQYEFKEVLEKNMQLFFYPPRTGSYEIIPPAFAAFGIIPSFTPIKNKILI